MATHGNLLKVTVVSCTRLDNKEQISRPDPYVSINYGGNISTTHLAYDLLLDLHYTIGLDGPVFPETFVYTEIEGLMELNVHAWNKDSSYDFIGSGRISLAKALSQGFDDDIWPLESEPGRYGGVVRIIMNYTNRNKPPKDSADKPSDGYAPSAPPYVASPAPSYRIYPPNGVSHQAPYRPQTTSYPLSPYPPYESIHHPGCGDEMGRNAFGLELANFVGWIATDWKLFIISILVSFIFGIMFQSPN
ncbi:hypothetical protein M8C21_027712 [Ambrosia artemisiifolia]|uniref:C2 domain-containing protein n=1 Tax=Ambrosia artemisiifolia TaxID=4212 RepID=A0AAD5GMM2_AMBAR|nr:hypothetical protein M8C21_027712 [Ambrosia artemisiifolia]